MRRVLFFIAIFLFTLSSVMGQMIPINLPADGNWPTVVGDSIMIIGPRQNELTEEQRYFNPVYLMVYPGKEHLQAQMIRAGLCDCDPTKPNRRIGVFSVAPDKQVSFSQGNLQYLPAINLWKFANTQYEYLGNANKYLKPMFRNWVDLFGWSANNTTAPFGISTSMNVADYAGDFVDWGTNTICGDAPGTWRTLSVDEWGYLFKGRKNATQLYSKGNIDGLRGMIILPDNWVMPEGLHFTAQPTNLTMELDINTYTQAEWQRMEEAGAVFLCPTGRRDGTKIDYLEYYGGYWSSSKISNSNHVCHMYYNYKSKIFMTDYKEGDYSYGTNGRSVRLVHDTIVPPPAPCETFKVNGVTFNMMCVEGGTFMMGSNDSSAPSNTRPAHPVTLSDFHIGQTEVTRALWRAVMDTVPGSGTDDMPVGHVTWEECQVFLTKLSEMTGKHFRLPTEAEWEYAARGGNKNKDFIYSGSDYADVVGWINYESNKIMPVAQKRCNQLGIYDMTGNSWEWCQDGGCRSYTTDSVINPIYVGASTGHVIRGGSFRTEPARCTNIARSTYGQNKGDSHISLRLVMDTVFPSPTPSKRIGVFSVAKDKQVSFSQGNLQYIPSANLWRFAENQYDYLGEENIKDGQLANRIDLFGWSGKDSNAPWGISNSTNTADYAGEFVDWGSNVIGDDAANTWRTLSKEEWDYIVKGRRNAEQLHSKCCINNVKGLLLLPDDWVSIEGISIEKVADADTLPSDVNVFTSEQWKQMETAGAVFLPAAGANIQPTIKHTNRFGGYCSSTKKDVNNSYILAFHVGPTTYTEYSNNKYGRSVRLVHDTIVPPPAPCDTFEVNGVTFNMMCVEGGTFQMGATEEQGSEAAANEFPVHEVTLSDYYIGQIEVTQRLWQTVMGSNPSTIKDSNKPVNNVTWEECQVFVEKLSQMTGYYFRLPTEAEWEYAARGGNRSRGYKYSGSDNIDEVAWYTNNSGGTTHTFATKQPNELGIYDMSGNVWEWCYDWYGPYSAEAQVDPTGPETGEYHMYRGGGWTYVENDCRVARRRQTASYNKEFLGLRLAMNQDAMIPLPEPDPVPTPSKRIGVFSVAADKQVSFSQGNLQYIQSTKTWQFAKDQYDYIGKGNIASGQLGKTIDMFAWSTDANPANKWGVTIAEEGFDGAFVDWGLNYIHGEVPGPWRTLSLDEWTYLFSGRQRATELWGVAQVEGVSGIIILPDRWNPTDELPFVAGLNKNGFAEQQTLSAEQWQRMEELGAVFLPAAGGRDGAQIASSHIDSVGWYWSSTPTNPDKAGCVRFECNLMVQRNGWRQAGLSVRLVHDTIVSKVEPEYVDLGLSVKWATFNVGAKSSNEIGSFYAWGEIETKDTYTVNNYKWWNKTSKEITKYCTIDSLAYGGVADGLTELQPQDDIAHILKGEHWRMPDLDECKELVNGCTWTVSTRQGQIGFEGISKINGNTIFLPVAGFRAGANLVYETLGGYWSSTLNIEKQSCAMGLYLNQETPAVNIYYNSNRQNGFLIRPVYDEVPDPCLVVKVNDTLSINLMCVEGGTFMMGSDAPDAQADEQPVHEVTLSDYYIGQTEVIQHLWKAVMGSGNNPSAVKGNNLPVTNITWDEAQVFVERLSELTGMRFRLPTEAEWEYAARGGQKSKGYTYAGSNDIDQVGWYNGNSSNKTHAVGQKQPNELGIYDMTGNVWEYCSDWHMPYAAQAQTNPTGAATGDKHVLRGGCYHYDPKNCTNTNRHSYYTPDKGGASTGLRIVLEP